MLNTDGCEVVVGVEADLMHVGAVAVHDMQQKYGLFRRAIVGHGGILGAVLVEQDGLGRELAGGCEHDASVRQVVRADIMARP